MKHPKLFFGVARDCSIIPLKLDDIRDIGKGDFVYVIGLNQLNPTEQAKKHHQNDFKDRIVTEGSPLFGNGSRFCETLQDAKVMARDKLRVERERAVEKLRGIDLRIANVNSSVSNLGSLYIK